MLNTSHNSMNLSASKFPPWQCLKNRQCCGNTPLQPRWRLRGPPSKVGKGRRRIQQMKNEINHARKLLGFTVFIAHALRKGGPFGPKTKRIYACCAIRTTQWSYSFTLTHLKQKGVDKLRALFQERKNSLTGMDHGPQEPLTSLCGQTRSSWAFIICRKNRDFLKINLRKRDCHARQTFWRNLTNSANSILQSLKSELLSQ